MSTFEYVSILISIIIGLGITHILMTWGQLLSGHRGYKTHWIHVLWTGNLLLFMVFFWWFTFKWVEQPEWGFGLFLFTLGYAVILYLLAVVLLPFGLPEGFDFREHYFSKRHLFFGGWFLMNLVDAADTVLKGPENLASLGPVYPWLSAAIMVGIAGAAITRREAYHRVWAVLWPIISLGWIFYSMGATSVLRGD